MDSATMEVDSGKKSTVGHQQGWRTTGGIRTTDSWTECFQDLGTWCRPDPDELNTPQLSFQDEFSFSLEGQENNCVWDLQSPVEQLNSGGGGGDWGLCQEQPQLLESAQADEENNNLEYGRQGSGVYPEKPLLMNNFVNPVAFLGGSVTSGAPPVLRNRGNVLLSQCTLGGDLYNKEVPEVQSAAALAPNSGDYMKSSKLNSSIYYNSGGVAQETPTVVKMETVRVKKERVGARRTGRPRLKLDIGAAATTAGGGAVQEQAGAAAETALDTPEVLTTLTDISQNFNLLKYICGDSESNTTPVAAVVKKEHDEEAPSAIQDHNYTSGGSSWSEDGGSVRIKSEPGSPLHHHHLYIGGGRSGRGKRVSETSDEAYHNRSEEEEEEDDDVGSDGSWSPRGRSSVADTEAGSNPAKRRRKRKTSTDSLGSIEDKYRALRDRNNEASRRSRLNRKQRDAEMRKYKNELEKKNVELKVKADKMDKLVKEMRAALMNAIKNGKK